MFDDVGKKIKSLAKFCVYVCLICGALIALIGFCKYLNNADYLEYATANGGSFYSSWREEKGNSAYTGLQMLKYGLIGGVAGLISSWPLYGFGELIEEVTVIARKSIAIADNTKKEDN